MSEENKCPLTDFDRMVVPESIQVMKAMIPYVPPRGQRFLSLYAKAMELQNTLSMFGHTPPDMSMCSTNTSQSPVNPLEMISEIRNYCSPITQNKLDECMNMLAMIQMMEVFQDNGQ